MIGILPAAPGDEDRKAPRIGQILRPRRGSRRVERRMFEEPDGLVGLARGDRGHARLHRRKRRGVVRQSGQVGPFDQGEAPQSGQTVI